MTQSQKLWWDGGAGRVVVLGRSVVNGGARPVPARGRAPGQAGTGGVPPCYHGEAGRQGRAGGGQFNYYPMLFSPMSMGMGGMMGRVGGGFGGGALGLYG